MTDRPTRPAGNSLPALAILAGGANTRMQSLRGTIYKPFLPIEDASLVARHILSELSNAVSSPDVASLAVAPFRLPYGTVSLDATGTKVTRFNEKPLFDGLVNTGYMCLGRDVVVALKASSLATSLAELAQTGRLSSIVSSTAMWAMDTPTDVARLHAAMPPT